MARISLAATVVAMVIVAGSTTSFAQSGGVGTPGAAAGSAAAGGTPGAAAGSSAAGGTPGAAAGGTIRAELFRNHRLAPTVSGPPIRRAPAPRPEPRPPVRRPAAMLRWTRKTRPSIARSRASARDVSGYFKVGLNNASAFSSACKAARGVGCASADHARVFSRAACPRDFAANSSGSPSYLCHGSARARQIPGAAAPGPGLRLLPKPFAAEYLAGPVK
jgi:hypothetical protein